MAVTKQKLLDKVDLKNAQTAVNNAAGDIKDGLPQLPDKIDKASDSSIGSTIAQTAKNISQGNVNKDSWVYKNIVEPIVGKDTTPTHIYNKETGKLEPYKK